MDLDCRLQSIIGIALWACFKLAAIVALAVTYTGPSPTGEDTPTPRSFLILFGLGTVALVWAAFAQVVDKGWPVYLCLLGLFELPGLIVLAVLPDRNWPPRPNARPTRPPPGSARRR